MAVNLEIGDKLFSSSYSATVKEITKHNAVLDNGITIRRWISSIGMGVSGSSTVYYNVGDDWFNEQNRLQKIVNDIKNKI